MTRRPAEVVQVVGRARAGDPVTATARSLQVRVGRLGWLSRLTAADPSAVRGIDRFTAAGDSRVVVHTVDGGDGLDEIVAQLVDHPLTLVHHGSLAGSDRSVLRALRGSTTRALAADPCAREELRALGFAAVGPLDPRVADDAFDGLLPDDVTAASLANHPGPLVLGLGAMLPGRWTETLLAAFADVITRTHPSAVLSLCGPSPRWYRAHLHGQVVRRGLLSCDLSPPANEGEVLARVDRAAAVVSLHPTALDPYRRRAAQLGLPIVAPVIAGSVAVDPRALEPIPLGAGSQVLADALTRALDWPRRSATDATVSSTIAPLADGEIARALGLR